MVFKLEPKEEAFYEDGIKALLVGESCFIRKLDEPSGAEIYECGVNQEPSAIAYWIKYDHSPIGYFIMMPFGVPGGKGYTAVRGWVEKTYRGMGLYSKLLITACSKGSLVSDRDGTTPDAYNVWLNLKGVSCRYFDQHTMRFVEEGMIPEEERFTSNPEGRRWLMVLEPPTST